MALLRTLDEVALAVRAAETRRGRATDAGPRTLVGLAGAPGSGKSTVGEALVARLNAGARPAGAAAVALPRAQLVSMDGYHLPQARLVELGRRDRMGAPDTFDVDGFLALLRLLRSARGTVVAPGFDREVEEPTPGAVAIGRERSLVVVEGNYLLHDEGGWAAARPLLDLTLFVGLERGIRLGRLVARHERFGKTAAQARAWALGPDEANARLIERTRGQADHEIRLA
ncbi:nucleoside/nucleotide kinase family protein [Cryobacterium sinapicolor]|uniref:Nucleoside/nucleotide kinase family protein n=1 Tax=Cryobacterium sinapicolor TaxID=1259236 RepID=A0ABY2JKC8_9MICO|nr:MULTISPECIES: nucleoside/nucleotide kinase family protein [Cryobacterium]TFC93733.1 nucleoside/nucleotide kinase family protein [Cryobacterium sp. TMT3-29-2]TFD05388.1 nucleoside/nucleotide kinase family protein [Cryobacterium sinapicolor]